MGDAYITRRGGGDGESLSALASMISMTDKFGYSSNKNFIVYAGRYALFKGDGSSYTFLDMETETSIPISSVTTALVFDRGIMFVSSYYYLYLADPVTMTTTLVYSGSTSGASIETIVPIPDGVLFLDDNGWLRKYVYGDTKTSVVTSSDVYSTITAILNGYVITGYNKKGYWYNCDTEQCVYMGTTYVTAVATGKKILYTSQDSGVLGLWVLDPETDECTKLINSMRDLQHSIAFGDKFIVSGYGAAVFDPETNAVEVICATPNGNQLGDCIAYNFDGDILILYSKKLYAYDSENRALGDVLATSEDAYLLSASYSKCIRQVPGVGWMIVSSSAREMALYKNATKTVQLIQLDVPHSKIMEVQGGCLLYHTGMSFFDDNTLTVTTLDSSFNTNSELEYGRNNRYTLFSSYNYNSRTLYLFDSHTKQMSKAYDGGYLSGYGSYLNIGDDILLCAYRPGLEVTSSGLTYNIYRPLYFHARTQKVFDLGAAVRALSKGGANDEGYIYVKREEQN